VVVETIKIIVIGPGMWIFLALFGKVNKDGLCHMKSLYCFVYLYYCSPISETFTTTKNFPTYGGFMWICLKSLNCFIEDNQYTQKILKKRKKYHIINCIT